MNTIKLPCAKDSTGRIRFAVEADKNEIYTCPQCNELVILKKGDQKQPHFAHKLISNCNFETLEHLIAKEIIDKIIKKNSVHELEIKIQLRCSECETPFIFKIPKGTFNKSKQECLIRPFVCDVVAFINNTPRLAFEILQTHKLDERKQQNLSLYWIELNAKKIITDSSILVPDKYSLKKVFCRKCKLKMDEIKKLCVKYNISTEAFNNPKYKSALTQCWNCKNKIPIFSWKEAPFATKIPPKPMPENIKKRFSKTKNIHYFANTCPICDALIGDTFLYELSSGPFSCNHNSKISIREVSNKMFGFKI